METTQRFSLYSYPYLNLAEHCVFLIIFHVFFFYKIENKKAEQVLPSVGMGGGRGRWPE
jgi:hypothetical protein